jgi:hypothetical protein
MGANARERFERLYSPDNNYLRLAEIYRSAAEDMISNEAIHD